MQIEKQAIITFRWWKDDESEINPDHTIILERAAWDRITDMKEEGYTSGELIDHIAGIDYQGWWKIEIKEVV